MHVYDGRKQPIELELLEDEGRAVRAGVRAFGGAGETAVARASRAFFEMGRMSGPVAFAAAPVSADPPPAVFRERGSGRLRTFYRELVVRFHSKVTAKRRQQVLDTHGLAVRDTNAFVRAQVVVYDPGRKRFGTDLLDAVNDLAQMEEVVFATPNFVSEYRRGAVTPPKLSAGQWHLRNLGKLPGQVKGEDVDALGAWELTRGKPSIVVAVLDDGVDLEHPDLKGRIWRNPDKNAADRFGRDFFLGDDDPDHFNPRPKIFNAPFDQMAGNDVHGTCCAGIIAAAGKGAWGIAPRCQLLAVKIFHADDMARDDRVADAIRYAASRGAVVSCSWSGPNSADVELAIEDAGRAREGRGVPVFVATGNFSASVTFPAVLPTTIAVGASTDGAALASYSDTGPRVDVVAPSSGGVAGIFTTDVSTQGRGFNVGRKERGGLDGLYNNAFGGTSAATPLAAGIGALMLSVNPDLGRDDLRQILRETARKIAGPYDQQGHSNDFGYGRVDAARAVAEAKARAK